jgi:hypothetical protein
MALESLLTLFDADVAASQAPILAAPATSATAGKFVTLQTKPAPLLGCTAATSATAEIINPECETPNPCEQAPCQHQANENPQWRHLQTNVARRSTLQLNTGAGSSCNGSATSATADDSALTLILSDVADVADVQANNGAGLRCNVTKIRDVADVADPIADHRLSPLGEEVPDGFYATPDRLADTRRTCRRCRELAGNGRCMAAGRGELPMTARQYEPVTDRLERCIGYLPGSDDPDQRPGRERYPHLAARAGR